MLSRSSLALALCLAVGPLLVGCSDKVEPAITSSAGHGAYGLTYPGTLREVTQSLTDRQASSTKIMAQFPSYPDKLRGPQWGRVVEVVERADEVGRSHAYVERTQRVEGAHAFFEAEKDEFNKRVAGSAQYLAKKKGCDVEIGGAVSGALKETVDKQLEKELRDSSDAHVLIDRYKAQIKKENVVELEKQADAIELASYVIHVEMVTDRQRLMKMLDEADAVHRTQAEFIETEQKWRAEKGLTEPEKKESDERVAAMKKAQVEWDGAVSQARALAPKLEEQTNALNKQYDEALRDLVSRLKAKASKESK